MDIECSDKEKRHCRICFSEETNSLTEDFKFITPCKCKGTSQFIHVSCLKEWLASKRVVKKHTSASTHTNNQGAVQEQNTQSIANNNAGSNTYTPIKNIVMTIIVSKDEYYGNAV